MLYTVDGPSRGILPYSTSQLPKTLLEKTSSRKTTKVHIDQLHIYWRCCSYDIHVVLELSAMDDKRKEIVRDHGHLLKSLSFLDMISSHSQTLELGKVVGIVVD